MGHFSYTCHLSGLPITGGTDCVLLPILAKQNTYDLETESLKRYGVGCILSNDGANAYFNEMCFPIFGKYDEYGGLEEIVKDDNIKVLEKFFNLKIEKIVECLLDNRKDQFKVDQIDEEAVEDEYKLSSSKSFLNFKKYPNQLFLIRASATWYRRDVYDNLIAKYLTESKNRDPFDKLDIGVFGLLKKLGFKKSKEEFKGRYNTKFVKQNVEFYSDGNWINSKPGENAGLGIYNLKALQQYCNDKKVKLNNFEKLNNMTYAEQVYECILFDVKKLERHDRWNSERVMRILLGNENLITDPLFDKLDQPSFLKKEIDNYIKMKEEKPDDYAKLTRDRKFDPLAFYEEMYQKALKKKPVSKLPILYYETILAEGNGYMLKNIRDWHIFKSYYYATGRFLYPVGTAAQDGDHIKVLQLAEVALEAVKKDVADRAELYAELEEDEA